MCQSFEKEVIESLTAPQKFLSSKYFYDDEGSRIFKEIMQMPEYYLSDCEFEILEQQAAAIFGSLNFDQPFNIIEFGAGDGSKTFKLLEYLVLNKVDFSYIPIDISQEAMNMLTDKLKSDLPDLKIEPQVGDYFEVMSHLNQTNKHQSLLLFLGSNIGNYPHNEAVELLKLFKKAMKNGDKLLMGIDLQKNPQVIHQAYSDPKGITKRFNLNLLKRMNSELNANFSLNDFDFYCYYNPRTGELYSCLVSLKSQDVYFPNTNKTISFAKDELIWTEQSKKYTFKEIAELADKAGFWVDNHFLDSKHYFTDCLLSNKN